MASVKKESEHVALQVASHFRQGRNVNFIFAGVLEVCPAKIFCDLF